MPTGWSRLYKYLTLRWVIRYPLIAGAIQRFYGRSEVTPGAVPMLEALNFLHFARWVILNKKPIRGFFAQGLPYFKGTGQPREQMRDGIMLFTSNFDNDWAPYVDTFMEAADDALGVFWDNMRPGWRRPTEIGFEEFFEFVNDHVVESDYYYAAFPELQTADIKSALFVDRHVRAFILETHRLDDRDHDAWRHALEMLVLRLDRSLGRITMKEMGGSDPAFGDGGGGQHVALTSLAPLRLERVGAVRLALDQLARLDESPFRQVDGTHFARLVLIDEIPSAKRSIPLKSGYLLLSADADGTTGSSAEWLGRLWDVGSGIELETHPYSSGTVINALWGECYGFGRNQSRAEFIEYIMKTSFNPTVPFADYPEISLWDIHRAIQTHKRFTDFVFSPQYATADSEHFSKCVEQKLLPVDPPPTPGMTPNLKNVQANVLTGTSKWRHSCYVFYRIDEADKARGFLKDIIGQKLMANAKEPPGAKGFNVNLAFTAAGLTKLGKDLDDGARYRRRHVTHGQHRTDSSDGAGPVSDSDTTRPEDQASTGGSAFAQGMKARASRLDDAWPESAQTVWWTDDTDLESRNEADVPHLLVWISATDGTTCHGTDHTPARSVLGTVEAAAHKHGGVVQVGRQRADMLEDGYEHFGFLDGVSQPAIEAARKGFPGDGKIGARGWEPIKVGEFLLGYPDEGFEAGRLPEAKAELLRDGTFLVYRKLRQDVEAFRKVLSTLAESSDDAATDEVAEKLMGRAKDGAPLMRVPGITKEETTEKLHRNDFTYREDPEGAVCPFTSHVRRANPRNDLHFEGRRVNRHRIIRRGMPYGPPYDEDPEAERGLIFIAFNARIEDQFEFIQQEWLNGGRVFRTGDDADLIAGAPSPKGRRIVLKGDKPIVHHLTEDVTQFRGGEYFFVPSLSALELISEDEGEPSEAPDDCDEATAAG